MRQRGGVAQINADRLDGERMRIVPSGGTVRDQGAFVYRVIVGSTARIVGTGDVVERSLIETRRARVVM